MLVIQWLYLLGGLSTLAAVTVVLHRLGYGKTAVVAPFGATLVATAVFQLWNFLVTGLPPFAFGIYIAVMPAISLIAPVCVIAVAASSRLTNRNA